MTIAEARHYGHNILRQASIASRQLDTSLLLEKASGKPRAWLFAHAEAPLTEPQTREFIDLIERRADRVPLVHLTNQREFYGLDFYVDERVLTPRVETEKTVELAIQYAPKHSRLLDVGTGCGALAIAIKKYRPDLDVWATDISNEALEVAALNASSLSVLISTLRSDLLESVSGHFSTIVTNLPYLQDDADLMPEVTKEPGVALFGGEDGLGLYRRFLKQLPGRLESGGYLFTECDPWQQEALIKSATTAGLTLVEPNNYFILGFRQI